MAMQKKGLDIAVQVARISSVPLDRLPYTSEFDRLAHEFVIRFGRPLSHAEVWEYLLGARKRGLLKRRQRNNTKGD